MRRIPKIIRIELVPWCQDRITKAGFLSVAHRGSGSSLLLPVRIIYVKNNRKTIRKVTAITCEASRRFSLSVPSVHHTIPLHQPQQRLFGRFLLG